MRLWRQHINVGLQDTRIMGDNLLVASGIHAENPGCGL
jgi:hypothetical protein